VSTQFIHSNIKGLLVLSLVFSLFVLEKANYPILMESIHSEWILEANESATYRSVFSFPEKKILPPFQIIDKVVLFIQTALIKLVLILATTLSLYTVFINKRSTFPIHIFSSEVPHFYFRS